MAETQNILRDLSELIVDMMNDTDACVLCRGKKYQINDEGLPAPAQREVKKYIRSMVLSLLRT